jgi:hypothetical protein
MGIPSRTRASTRNGGHHIRGIDRPDFFHRHGAAGSAARGGKVVFVSDRLRGLSRQERGARGSATTGLHPHFADHGTGKKKDSTKRDVREKVETGLETPFRRIAAQQ